MKYLENDAALSTCGTYRYLLRRVWDHSKPRALFCMLNPSTADAKQDDATIRSCVRLLSTLGYGSLEVVNMFGFRSTDPDELHRQSDPVGPENESVIRAALGRCDIVMCAWGGHATSQTRKEHTKSILRAGKPAIYCFGKTMAGNPLHPLYLKTGTQLQVFA